MLIQPSQIFGTGSTLDGLSPVTHTHTRGQEEVGGSGRRRIGVGRRRRGRRKAEGCRGD